MPVPKASIFAAFAAILASAVAKRNVMHSQRGPGVRSPDKYLRYNRSYAVRKSISVGRTAHLVEGPDGKLQFPEFLAWEKRFLEKLARSTPKGRFGLEARP